MASTSFILHRWDAIEKEPLTGAIDRQFITCDRLTIATIDLKRGAVVPRHAHENEQVSSVLKGALRFVFDDGQAVVVRPGQVMQIPGSVAHEVEALEDSTALDIFSPIRQDWIDKTDDYFRK